MKKGFTLIEMLVYIAVLSVIILSVSSFFLWVLRTNDKFNAMREVLDSNRRAVDIIVSEIREAKSIYLPTTTSGQLSLEITKDFPDGEGKSYVDFYLCGMQLCLKKESQNPIAITSDKVQVFNISFTKISSGSGAPSVQINMTINYIAPPYKPEYQASITTTSTASIRLY